MRRSTGSAPGPVPVSFLILSLVIRQGSGQQFHIRLLFSEVLPSQAHCHEVHEGGLSAPRVSQQDQLPVLVEESQRREATTLAP